MALSAETRRRIREEFPAFAYLLNEPDVANVLGQAVEQGWDIGKLQANLYRTSWWRRHSETSRNWSTLVATDPAEAGRRRQEMISRVSNEARRLGVKSRGMDLYSIMETALKRGYTDAQITQAIAQLGRRRGFAKAGALRANIDDLRALGKQYAINLSAPSLQNWAIAMATGRLDEDGMRAYIKGKAVQSLDPSGKNEVLRRGLNMGLTVRDVYSGVIETVANELEVDDSRVDLSDNYWGKLVRFRDEEGVSRPMNETEAIQWARGQTAWQATNTAKEHYSGLANAITTKWGLKT
jgi:hypothetical protein